MSNMNYCLNCIVRYENEGAILINKENIISVNELGAMVCYLIEHKVNSINSIVNKLSNIFNEVPKETLIDDISDFINEMEQEEYLIGTLNENLNVKEDKDFNLLDELEFNRKSYLDLKSPLMVHIDLTDKCNQNCVFCYNSVCSDKKLNKISIDNWEKVISNLNDNKVGKFNFLGGEPLIVFDDMIRLFEKTNKFSFVSFSTNGSYNGGITDEQCKKLIEFKDRLSVRVSINGFLDKHDNIVRKSGAFNAAVNTIKKLAEYGISVSVNVTVNKSVLEDWKEIIAFFSKIDVTDIEFRDWQYFGQGSIDNVFKTTPLEYEELVKNINKFIISTHIDKPILINNRYIPAYRKYDPVGLFNKTVLCGIYKSMHIKSNGDVFICHGGFEDNLKLGNVFNNNIESIWNNPLRKKIISTTKENMNNNVCKKCEQVETCLGGCKIASYKFFNNFYEGDPMCPRVWENLYHGEVIEK